MYDHGQRILFFYMLSSQVKDKQPGISCRKGFRESTHESQENQTSYTNDMLYYTHHELIVLRKKQEYAVTGQE